MKKKVLLISESMGGGLRKHVVQLIENLDSSKFEIFFIHGTDSLDEVFLERYESLKQIATLIPCNTFVREIDLKKDYTTLLFLSKMIKKIQPDIVHCHSSKAGVLGRIAARMNKIKKIFYTPHAYSFLAPEFGRYKKKLFIAIESILSRYATTKTFNVSKGEKEAALKFKLDKDNKFEVIYNGLPEIDLPTKKEARELIGIEEKNIVIGTNARMSEQKNPIVFMEVAKKVVAKNSNIHFVWAGEGILFKEIKKFLLENDLCENVHLLGNRTDSEIIVAGYDIFFSTALYEGLPYAPIEAMRAGIPIMLSNVTGNIELVKHNICGRLFELDNVSTISSSLSSFLLNKSLFNKEEIKKNFRKYFSEYTMINKIEDNYNRL